ncbi:ABC transporter substrate-binding protein [Histidinibacterium aquaticum]|uniref:ABC transporter substrate-binding protein n=1 Tax=Histidinibacterium aquaticum TaxID=2613962 RepID=A0A5J5GJ07_9RHOB|nr:ABC transporter substrate-binding protein [Histidinibacterium aquaticum]KAA9008107.1 ABC transporter substrate-binding protein [Histidinibacterium aquaticum]
MTKTFSTRIAATATGALLAFAPVVASAQEGEPIKMGHLTYHTGPFNAVGDLFDGITNFAVDVVNEDPPLGRPIEVLHRDIGTLGEAQVARRLLDSDNVEILLNAAHNYLSYRDFALDHVAENGRPIMPSVHGGAIDSEYGGTAEEPLFRGSPMDSAQGVAAVVHAHNAGAENVVVVASEIAGSQLQKDGAVKAAEELGMEVLAVIDVQAQAPTYRSVISRIGGMNPDAVVFFSPGEDGGTFVKNAAEAGNSWLLIGSSDWLLEEFSATATMSAIDRHEAVLAAGFTHADTPAWETMQELWENSEYADLGEPSNSYALQYYDLIVLSALAIEQAGSTDPEAWSEAMYAISSGDGEQVYSYAEGLEKIRAGEAINYEGVTGAMDYTDTGVVSGLFGVFEWTDLETLEQTATVDGAEVLRLDQL